MSNKSLNEPQPQATAMDKSPMKRYFFPEYDKVVKATSYEEAVNIVQKKPTKEDE